MIRIFSISIMENVLEFRNDFFRKPKISETLFRNSKTFRNIFQHISLSVIFSFFSFPFSVFIFSGIFMFSLLRLESPDRVLMSILSKLITGISTVPNHTFSHQDSSRQLMTMFCYQTFFKGCRRNFK